MRWSRKLLADDRLGLLDYALAAMAGMTATYSIGMALMRPAMGWFFVIGVGLGMMASFILQRRFSSQKWIEIGGFLYFIFAVSAVFYTRQLNDLLPDGGFSERELTVASILAWMILFGSWVSWKDNTLLFQAVPSIALFGLVGAFNTFQGSTIAFFVFLLCLATLFARAHARSMMKQALDSGFTRLDTIRQGPWRWMAGPEWALVSAAVVILISVFGAPILQESVKGVSGLVRLPLPNMMRQRNTPQSQNLPPGAPIDQTNSVGIGLGPVNLLPRLVFQAKLDQPRYLRIATYSTYQRGTWNRVQVEPTLARLAYDQSMAERARLIKGGSFQVVPFEISFEGMTLNNLPAPGEVVEMDNPDLFQILLDGGVGLTTSVPLNSRFAGRAAVVKPDVVPTNTPAPLHEFLWRYLATTNITDRITNLSEEVAAEGRNDWEKAQLIKQEIERRCRYNLNAERAPGGADPVDNFLFGEKKEGYCDLFASAMVLMARVQGIPSRYVRGYFPLQGDADGDGWYPVGENDAHAWAELYFEGVGWVPFDPTEGAQEVPGSGRGEANDTTPFYQKAWFAWFLNGLIVFAVFGAGAFALGGVRRARASLDWETIEMARNYEHFASSLQRASGQPRRPNQTATEYLDLVSDRLGTARDEAAHVNALFVQALYGPPTGERPTATDLRAPVQKFRRTVKDAMRHKPPSA